MGINYACHVLDDDKDHIILNAPNPLAANEQQERGALPHMDQGKIGGEAGFQRGMAH